MTDSCYEASNKLKDLQVSYNNFENNLFKVNSTMQPVVIPHEIVADSTENFYVMDEDGKTNNRLENVTNKTTVVDEARIADQIMPDKGSEEAPTQGSVTAKRKRRRRRRKKTEEKKDDVQVMDHANVLSNLVLLDGEVGPQEGVCSGQGSRIESLRDRSLSTCEVKEVECLSNETGKLAMIPPVVSSKRKLLVLDVNGLLAYIVMPGPKDLKEDTRILGRAIFKRPYCEDFLRFCFQNFDVGIWSSRAKKIIDRVVEYLFGDLKDKLLFCWDMMHSTQTGFKTLENIHKPLVCKELSKIWEPDDSSLPWKKGDYDSSNTLLLDDSPYKALLNPLHTAIFPKSYHYEDKDDNSLGPGGDIRVYLEGLLGAENVQTYVSQNPFGQGAINETNVYWEFYSVVLQNLSNRKGSDGTVQPSSSELRSFGNHFH